MGYQSLLRNLLLIVLYVLIFRAFIVRYWCLSLGSDVKLLHQL